MEYLSWYRAISTCTWSYDIIVDFWVNMDIFQAKDVNINYLMFQAPVF